jgi:serine/threonine-protein phosphatase 5
MTAEAATALKQKGNKAFAAHDWPTAVDFYTQAIEANGQDPSFYCNRAQVPRRQHFLLPAIS